MTEKKTGKILWRDLTVDQAEVVRDFYCKIAGWEYSEHNMGNYSDYNIIDPDTKEVIAGICHKKGPNANIPSQWLLYTTVENLEEKLQICRDMGGKVLDGPRKMGGSNFAVIQDPAGAVMGLIES